MEICVLTPLDLEKFAHLYPPYLLKELPGDALLLGCIAEDPLEAASVLLGHVEEDEVIVDWLYVDEPFRRKGGASAMLELLIETAAEAGKINGVNVFYSEESDGMEELLKTCGFLVGKREGDKGFLTSLGRFPRLPSSGEKYGEIMTLSQVPKAEMRRFASLIEDNSVPGVPIDLPFEPEAYLPESSAILIDGKITGVILFDGDAAELSIPWIFNSISEPAPLISMINHAVGLLKEKYPADTPLCFASVNIGVEEVVERYIPVISRSEIYFGTYRFEPNE